MVTVSSFVFVLDLLCVLFIGFLWGRIVFPRPKRIGITPWLIDSKNIILHQTVIDEDNNISYTIMRTDYTQKKFIVQLNEENQICFIAAVP